MALRWGIAGAGKISNDFVSSLKSLPTTDHQVVAVAARSLSSAKNFAETHKIPNAYEGYLKIAQDKDVDIVYIGNLNPQHFETAKLMLEHGKHILCEKPFTMNEGQTRTIIELAKNKKLFAAEAVWSRSFPVYAELERHLKAKTIGEVLQVYASFGFDLQGVERLKAKELGGGTILDLGVYVLQFQQFVYRGLIPSKIFATGILNSEGTDDSVSALIGYPAGQTALVSTSGLGICPNEAVVVGTKGIIRIPKFWCPTQLIVNDATFDFPLPLASGSYNFVNSVGLSYQAEIARQMIHSGNIENSNITHEESIQLARLMDTLRKQVGVIFPEDL